MATSKTLSDLLILGSRIVMLARNLCNWLVASDTSQCIATHGAETRQCRRVITHSWIIGHISGNTRCFSDGTAQVFSLRAVRVKFLDCMAGSADVEEFGGCAVFFWVQHIGTSLRISTVSYACRNASPFGAKSEENLAAAFLLDDIAGSRRVCGSRHGDFE